MIQIADLAVVSAFTIRASARLIASAQMACRMKESLHPVIFLDFTKQGPAFFQDRIRLKGIGGANGGCGRKTIQIRKRPRVI
jgi:hypothetical protein